MTQRCDSMKSEIHGVPKQGFANLNTRVPFIGYGQANTYFERCLPKSLSEPSYRSMIEILGVGGVLNPAPYASNVRFIQDLSKGLQKTLPAEWTFNEGRGLHLLTITPAEWVVSEYRPVVNIKRWRMQAQRWLARLDMTAIAFIEAAPFVNYPASVGGRAIAFHLHAVGYITDMKRFQAALASLRGQLDKTMVLKLPSVVVKPFKPTEADVAYGAGYIAKVACSAKRVSLERNGKDVLRNAPLPKLLGLRLAEILSFLTPQELIVARGRAAQRWKRSILVHVGRIATQRYPGRLHDGELRGLWCETKEALVRQTASAKKKRKIQRQTPVTIIR